MTTEEVAEVNALAELLWPMIEFYSMPVQGAVLTRLLSRLLASIDVPGDRSRTVALRCEIFEAILGIVRAQVAVMDNLDA